MIEPATVDKDDNVLNGEASIENEAVQVSSENECRKRLDFDSEKVVINQMNDLSLAEVNGMPAVRKCGNGIADENDSGVDTGVALANPVQLQRALSNNSGGYTSSSGGLDGQFASCNSSLLSVCSDSNEEKPSIVQGKISNDCTSENGSESSSVSGGKQRLKQNSAKKRVALTEPQQTKTTFTADTIRSRLRATSVNRTTERTSIGTPSLSTSERARSRDKQVTSNSSSKKNSPSSPAKRAIKPTTLSINGNSSGNVSDTAQRVATVRRAVSMSRRSTNCTPNTEDGRWPSIVNRSASKTHNRNESVMIRTKMGHIVLENKAQTPDRYVTQTLPRRKRSNSEEDLSEWRNTSYRSSSTTRDRMTSSTIIRRPSSRESPNKPNHSLLGIRNQKPKTLIYHEALVQTVLTSQDIDDAFAGKAREIPVNAITQVSRECQADLRDKHIERLEEQIRSLTADNASLKKNLTERSQLLSTMEQHLNRERDEKTVIQQNTERFLEMLRTVNGIQTTEIDNKCDSLSMLESQIQLSGHALEKKQSEIDRLRKFCQELQTEMSRSNQMQQSLLEEKKCFEKETSELQDFLQDEKAAIVEALKDAETEIEKYESNVKQKDKEIERLQDECRHLVRICEQRRQEYLGMQSKCDALKSNSINIISQQNKASMALSDLKSRLNELIEQLIAVYEISDQDFETTLYQNGTNGNIKDYGINCKSSSLENKQQLITALVNAIKSATDDKVNSNGTAFESNESFKSNGLKPQATDMLDSETEPNLMIENGLDDVSLPESRSQSQNTISSVSMPTIESLNGHADDSLQNLCEAISNRQKIEEENVLMMSSQENGSKSPNGDQRFNDQLLIENVTHVNDLITKLFKILRIIQIESVEKKTIELNTNGIDGEMKNDLRLDEATREEPKNDFLQNNENNGQNTIEESNEGCFDPNSKLESESEYDSESESESKAESESNTGSDSEQSDEMSDDDEKNEENITITNTIKTLNGIQSIVKQCPALENLQRDLELMLSSESSGN